MMYGCLKAVCIVTLLVHGRFCICLDNDAIANRIGDVSDQDSVASQLTCIMERLTAMDQRVAALDLRVTEMSSVLNQRMNTLENRFNDMHQEAHTGAETDDVLTTTEGTTSPMPTTTTTTPSTTPEPHTRFFLTRVSKEDLGDSYRVRAEYEAASKPSVVQMKLGNREMLEQLDNSNHGSLEMIVPKDSLALEIEHKYTQLHISYPDISFTAHFNLKTTPSSMVLPRITAGVAQGSDVTYQPGSDVELDWTLKVEDDSKAVNGYEVRYKAVVKSEEEENRLDRYFEYLDRPGPSPVRLDVVRDNGQMGDQHRTFRINSTLTDPRGVLQIVSTVYFNCDENCLLSQLQSAPMVSFYSLHHSGPFPEGFLGFVHDKYEPDPRRAFCDVSNPDYCTVRCTVTGSQPSTTELVKVLPNGDVIATDDVRWAVGHWSDSFLKIPNVTFADAGEFRCRASSRSRVISMDISLVVVKAARINRRLSTATRFDNGTVAATCVAEGIPAPNVTFAIWFTDSPEDYDITVTQLDEYTTRTDIIITKPDLASTISAFFCTANIIDGPDKYSYQDYEAMTLYN